jgi:hypothetical protein
MLFASAAHAVTYPTMKSVSPKKLGIGDTMTIVGKGFRPGKNRNVVIFKREGGRAVFVKAPKATSTRITLSLPAKLLPSLRQKNGKPTYTRFRVRVLSGKLSRAYTAKSRSPLIGPSAVAKGSANDCDGDKIVNSVDKDDDNDLLSDDEEATIGTQSCARDSDGDGLSDGWEQRSAQDRNSRALPSPKRKPWPNALNAEDGKGIDSDGDGLSNLEEYTAWATVVQKFHPADDLRPIAYSGGDPKSASKQTCDPHTPATQCKPAPTPGGLEYMDRDGSGYLSDFEADADGDRIPNMDEVRTEYDLMLGVAGLLPDETRTFDYGLFGRAYLDEWVEKQTKQIAPLCAGINQVPFYCTQEKGPQPDKVDQLDWLESDSDSDTIRDDLDDVDHDDVSNITEYLTELAAPAGLRNFGHLDACIPDLESRFCLVGTVDVDRDGLDNRLDTDDDGDGLDDATEKAIKTNALVWDTDSDGVSDTYEYYSALDLNSLALPYPEKRPYPNPLDNSDANYDFDGDTLTVTDEYKAWRYTGSPIPLSYSDGDQWTGPGKLPATGANAPLDANSDGTVSDDERDADADGASNWTEVHGPLSGPDWWNKWVAQMAVKCSPTYTESPYPGAPYKGLSFVDADSDGDGLKDGADDIDHDGLTNAQESVRPANWCATYISTSHNFPSAPAGVTADQFARVQPFNPCKPIYSDACHVHPPLGYYAEDAQTGYVEDWASPFHG